MKKEHDIMQCQKFCSLKKKIVVVERIYERIFFLPTKTKSKDFMTTEYLYPLIL